MRGFKSMKISDSTRPFLTGEKFSEALRIRFDERNVRLLSRTEILLEKVKGKNIIHLGCADHLPLIRSKIAQNVWLHKLLSENARECLGLDIDVEAINFIREEMLFKNVIYCDATDVVTEEIINGVWDYLVIPDVLEHISDPCLFLKKIREKLGPYVKRAIITVPNAFFRGNFRAALSHTEIINSDHRFWFSPYTLAKILQDAGWEVEDCLMCDSFPRPPHHWTDAVNPSSILKKYVKRNFPLTMNTIVLEAKLNYS